MGDGVEERVPVARIETADLGYGSRVVLRDVSLALHDGEFLGIVGPNGSGKTTFLRALLGLLRPLRGVVRWGGEGRRPPKVGYVPQRQTLDPIYPLTALDVVLMGLYREIGPVRRPRADHVAAAERALRRAAIGEVRDEPLRELSGGQQQRVLIARALAAEPGILLLDEPTNGMDLLGEHSIMEFLRDLHANEGKTIVMVSHLLHVVANYADRLALVRGGSLRAGPIDEMLTAEELGRTYGIPVVVSRIGGRRVIFPGGGQP